MSSTFNKSFSTLQKVGKSLMMPVSVLPAAGLLVALGRVFQDAGMTGDQITNTLIHTIGQVMFSGGLAIFEQLPVVFAIGVAIGFTGGAAVAGLASVVGYFTLTNVLKVMTEARGLELSINTGVFGGIIIGLLAAQLYKKFFQTKLHPVLGFFSGKRLVPIVTTGASVVLGIALGFVWPPIQDAINSFGTSVMDSYFGPAFYAAGKRMLIPVGLHHVYYPPFLYEFGSFITSGGKEGHGESARYFAGDPTAGRFMASEFPIMLFGLPAAAFAMYLRAPAEKRKAVGGIMLSAALTSIITGITEPIEFAFIFVAPFLYIFHVLAAFASGYLTTLFDIQLGYTFSASIIDFGIGFFNQKNSWALWLVVGPAIAALYFSTFYYAIKLFNFKTPGRDSEESDEAIAVDASDRAFEILRAFGGSKNLNDLDACITRLRVVVNNPADVDQAKLKSLGAAGIMVSGSNFQVIYGVESDSLKEEIKSIIASGNEDRAPSETKVILNDKIVENKEEEKRDVIGKEIMFRSPLTGELVPIHQVPDPTFSEKILGDGIAIRPDEGILYAPVDGKISQLFRTNHAIGMVTEDGAEILVHVGLDTVKMNGEGFKAFVKTGDQVKAGDKLLEFNLDLIRSKASSDVTPIVVTNLSEKVQINHIAAAGKIKANDELFNLSLQ